MANRGTYPHISSQTNSVPHPELLDTAGNLIKDPLLVMRSISVEDALRTIRRPIRCLSWLLQETQEEG